MKTRKVILPLILLLCACASAQSVTPSGLEEKLSQTTSGASGTLTFPDAIGANQSSFEMIVNGGPASVSVTINGVMRGGTTTVLATSTSLTNVVLAITAGPYDSYTVVWSVGGGSSPTLTFNWTGIAMGNGALGGTVTAVQSSGANLHVDVDNAGVLGSQQTLSGTTCPGAGCVTYSTNGASAVEFNIPQIATGGTVTFLRSIDGTNWLNCPAFPTDTFGWTTASSTTVTGQWVCPVAGYNAFQLKETAYTSGSTLETTNTTTAPLSDLIAYTFDVLGDLHVVLQSSTLTVTASNTGTPTTGCSGTCTGLTTAVVVKASAGNLYGFTAYNGAATVCFVEFINTASAPALGTNAVFSVAIPATTSIVWPQAEIPLVNFSTGISVGLATAYNGATACGTAGDVYPIYK